MDINYFKSIQNAYNCNNYKERSDYEIQTGYINNFDKSSGVVYAALRNGTPQDFIITSKNEENEFYIYPRFGEEINIGDIIIWNNLHWLVVDKNFVDNNYKPCTIKRCNRTIRWQNSKTLEIIERWCFCSLPYSAGVQTNNILSTLDGKYKIQLPYDDETKLLNVDKRIMFDVIDDIGEIYKIIFSDKNTNKFQDINGGFIELVLASDVQTANDNTDLLICDYIEPNIADSPTLPPVDLFRCQINGRDTLKLGYLRKYNAIFYDAEDNIVNDIVPKWEVVFDKQFDNLIQITETENSLEIETKNNENLLGAEVLIKLCDDNGLYDICEFKVMVVSAFG